MEARNKQVVNMINDEYQARKPFTVIVSVLCVVATITIALCMIYAVTAFFSAIFNFISTL